MDAPACPICSSETSILDVVDFNKSCGEKNGQFLPLSGIPVYYFICDFCSHTFSPEFWNWTEKDFQEKIYNAQYAALDPDYVEARPAGNARFLIDYFGRCKSRIRHLDYGGGNGRLSQILQADCWDSSSFDPFPASDTQLDSLGKFNLITAFEVFEHVPDPDKLMENILQLMDQSCMFFFSTYVSDDFLKKHARITWWYCSPCNGHISLFSRKSLALLGARHGLRFASCNENLHCYTNAIPAWFGQITG
jgi:SAM-dependent methyltransferase